MESPLLGIGRVLVQVIFKEEVPEANSKCFHILLDFGNEPTYIELGPVRKAHLFR